MLRLATVALLTVALLTAGADGHGMMVFPPSRNAFDRFLPQFRNGQSPQTPCTCPNSQQRDHNGDHGSSPCEQGNRSDADAAGRRHAACGGTQCAQDGHGREQEQAVAPLARHGHCASTRATSTAVYWQRFQAAPPHRRCGDEAAPAAARLRPCACPCQEQQRHGGGWRSWRWGKLPSPPRHGHCRRHRRKVPSCSRASRAAARLTAQSSPGGGSCCGQVGEEGSRCGAGSAT